MHCTVLAGVLTAIATRNMKQVQHSSTLLGMCPAGMCFPCPFTCDIWGSSPFRACVGACIRPAGFEKGFLYGGKPFLTCVLSQNPHSFSLASGTTLLWRETREVDGINLTLRRA